MSRLRVAGILVAAAMALAARASAEQYYTVHLTGELVSQGDPNGPNGSDANLAVGQPVTLTARFDAERAVQWGNYGYSAVGLYGLGVSGNEFFRIEAGGLTWRPSDDILDGQNPFYHLSYAVETTAHGFVSYEINEASPAIVFSGGKVVGVVGALSPASSERPYFDPGSTLGLGFESISNDVIDGPVTRTSAFTPFGLSNSFSIHFSDLYGNRYPTQGFGGVWNFADSRAAIPEPSIWLLALAGFGAMGAVLRARHGRITPVVCADRPLTEAAHTP